MDMLEMDVSNFKIARYGAWISHQTSGSISAEFVTLATGNQTGQQFLEYSGGVFQFGVMTLGLIKPLRNVH
jgi:hypothetical protein